MTRRVCMNCLRHWEVHTLHPGLLGICGVLCPLCIAELPLMDVHPLRRSA